MITVDIPIFIKNNEKNMTEINITIDELEKMYQYPPKDKETDYQMSYRMGRNSLILELIQKLKMTEYD